jgi:L-asparaginase
LAVTIRIFVTGGTFDKEYNELNGKLFFKDTHLPEMLKLGRCKLNLDIRTLMMVDSSAMTDSDREIILQNVIKAKENRIVITHGTDTMVTTARVLAKGVKDKTVVLTGAIIPYTFGSSDGLFNLGAALAFVQTLPQGVYISMNGRCFSWDNMRKNRDTGEFQQIKPTGKT